MLNGQLYKTSEHSKNFRNMDNINQSLENKA